MVGESPSDGSEGASTPWHAIHFGKNPISLEKRTIFYLLLASNFNWIHWKMKITKFQRFLLFSSSTYSALLRNIIFILSTFKPYKNSMTITLIVGFQNNFCYF